MINPDSPKHGNVAQSATRTPEQLIEGTEIEIVLRRTIQMILGPNTPEQPETGNGVATVPDVVQAIAPFMTTKAASLRGDRVRHWLATLSMRSFLTFDSDGYYVYIASKEIP